MIDGRHGFQARHEFRFGRRELLIFGCAFLLIWVLTFIFGVLVGREFAAPSGGGGRAGAAAAPAPAEGASPAKADRLRAEERLTFYRTLTAPTPDLPAVGQPAVEERLVPREPPAKPAPKAERRTTAAAATPAEARGTTKGEAAATTPPAGAVVPGPGERLWTVQVSSFRSRALAEDLRKRLVARGYDAYLTSVTTEEGRVRYRVRVGGFATRAEAERAATELRAERHPNVFVTTRSR